MELISNLFTYVLVVIIKFQEKTKPVKWCFVNFSLNSQYFAESKIPDFYVKLQKYAHFIHGSVLRKHVF